MLGIHISHNGNAATHYFNDALTTEGYYLNDKAIAVWAGKTSERLGLFGKDVTFETFSSLVNNRDPETGDRLTVRNADNRRAGYDFTFSAPKSVSLLALVANDQVVIEAHRKAYQAAMLEVEANIQTQANTSYGRFYEDTGNIIYAAFDHYTARPVDVERNGKTLHIGDPNLHSHCFLASITHCERKERFQALEVGNIHLMAPYYEAVYHSVLSNELQKSGYQIRRTKDRYEIAGVSRPLIDRFSSRTKTIEDYAREHGISDPKALAELGVKTRKSKKAGVKESELFDLWKERLSEDEFNILCSLKGNTFKKSAPVTAKEAVDKALEHFLERNSAVPEKRVIAEALRVSYGDLLLEDVRGELGNRKDILRSEIDTISHITTISMVQAENRMIAKAAHGRGKYPALNPDYQPREKLLNEQQGNALQSILSSKDFVTILHGSAGVGKTTLLTEVLQGIKQTNTSLFSVAPSSQATLVLNQKGFEASTIAALLSTPKLQERLKNNTLLVDEAGMCGVKTMNELLALAERQNSRLILSGDVRQHSSPEHGDALRILMDQAKTRTASVQQIVRQRPEEYRSAVELLAKGRNIEGFQKLGKMGAIKETPDEMERLKAIAEEYVSITKQKRSALIVSPTNAEGAAINQMVREKLKAAQLIKGEEKSISTLQNLSFTQAQKKDVANYSEGQIVRFVKNSKGGYKAGSHYEVLATGKENEYKLRELKTGQTLPLPHENTEHYQIYRKDQAAIAKGDLIRLTNNIQTMEGTKAFNGTSYKVAGFTKSGDIRLDNGKTMAADTFHFKHGYTDTSHSSQGKDSSHCIVSIGAASIPATTAQTLYVSTSRGRDSLSIHTSSRDDLKRAIIRSGERLTAREIAQGHERRLLEQKQRQHHKTLNEKLNSHERTQQRQKQNSRGIHDLPKHEGHG